jgi:hypothetical protein
MLSYLLIPSNTSDQPIDLMADIDEYVCDLNITESEVMDSLDDAIIQRYREIWS